MPGWNKDIERDLVCTLLALPEKLPLNDAEVNTVVDILQANGAVVTDVVWLKKEAACDIFFAMLPEEEAQALMEQALAAVPFDAIVQRAKTRRKKLLISDMDSTIIEQECIDELADFMGIKPHVAEITERAMNGELDFKEALRERVMLLKGLSESTLQEVYEKRVTFMPGARELVATMRANGAQCILISGGFTFFTNRVRDALGFNIDESNTLLIENGKLTGGVADPIVDKNVKRDALTFYTEKFGFGRDYTIAVGDGANDLPMIEEAGLGVAFHAKPKVRAAARAKLNTCYLDALLYAQGYHEGEVVDRL